MNLLESMQKRHAVRDYNDEPLTAEQVNTLDEAIAAANAKQGLDIQLIHDVDDARRIFRHNRDNGAHAEHAVCRKRLDIRLYSRAAAAIASGDPSLTVSCS